MKRAITLAGGGPAVGLSLGALKYLVAEKKMQFDVWAMSCIGAWLGVVWNQCDQGREYEQSKAFFEGVFRDDRTYSKFPIATIFAPDYMSDARKMVEFVLDPRSYVDLVLPDKIAEAAETVFSFMTDPRKWNQGDFNSLILNQFMAVNPWARFATSMMYRSRVNGLARVYYPDSSFLRQIRFERLYQPNKPVLYHNTYNMTDKRLEHYGNKDLPGFAGRITAQTLCACSALPYIEEPVEMNGKSYCEGATIDTVDFYRLVHDHAVDEVWVSRILDTKQVKKPDDLYDALNNLVMLFAATVSEDDVRLFKYHLQEAGRTDVKVVEIHVSQHANYDWTYSNLDACIEEGYLAAKLAHAAYAAGAEPPAELPPALQVTAEGAHAGRVTDRSGARGRARRPVVVA